MIQDKRVVVVIPARGGSKRLKHKNIYPVLGKPMLVWGVSAAKRSKYIDDVFVSSEDAEILSVAEKSGAIPLERPVELAQDHVFKMHAITQAVQKILDSEEFQKPDIVVVLQANSPEVKTEDLDAAIEKLIRFNRQEIFSVDSNLNQNAAFRILTREAVFQKDLSTNCGVYVAEYEDIHTEEDVRKVEERMKAEAPNSK